MRKTTTIILVVMALLVGSFFAFTQQNEEDAKFQKTLNEYLDALWKFYPTSATLAGYHNYDNKLEDLSSKNIEKQYETLGKFNQEFVAKVDQSKLSPEVLDDYLMIVDALDLEVIKHENLLPWEYDPLFYNNILANCVRSLLTKDFAPLETRANNAAERMKNIPKLIKQAKENLKTPPQIHTEVAIKQFVEILNFYKTELPQLIEQAPAAPKNKINNELPKVVKALEDYQNFLQNELLPRSTGNFRLQEAHRRLLRVKLQNNLTLEELVARAKADYNNLRREMFLVCIPFFKIMNPPFNIEQPPSNLTEEQIRQTVINHVLNNIKSEHVQPDEFLTALKNETDRIQSFLKEKDIINLPDVSITFNEIKHPYLGVEFITLSTPGAYETSADFTLNTAPMFADLSEEDSLSLLEEYNNYFLPFFVTRKIYPGTFVPAYVAYQHASLVQKLYPNQPLLRGWPLFVEDMLVYNGFGNYDLRLRLNQLKYKLKAVIDFLLEFNIHEGGMTKDQAISYMMRGGFQSKVEAERNWNRIVLMPGDGVFTYVGYQELLDLEKQYREAAGSAYSRKDFLEKVLSFGPLHLRQLKKKLFP